MTRIRQRTDTASQWTAKNPVLLEGEVGWEEDTDKAKRGDGTTAWASLPYVIAPISGYAPLASPTFTGDPKAPTPAPGDNDTSIATTAFVEARAAAAVIDSIADADTTHAPSRNAVFDALALKAPLASPTFTGDPKAPTPATADNDTSIATTAFVKAQAYAPIASPTFTGNPAAPTPSPGDNDTSVATTAFVQAAITAAMLAMHPIGSVRMQTVATNPGTFLGGTWVAWGTGRVPVGIDAGQTEFDTVEETGGAKTHTLTTAEMPGHTHISFTHVADTGTGAIALDRADVAPADASFHSSGVTSSTGGDGAHNNLQPYIVCYMFKRTA